MLFTMSIKKINKNYPSIYFQEAELSNKQERQRKRQEEFNLFKSDLNTRYETIDKNIEEKIKSIKLQYEEAINKLISDNQQKWITELK